MVHTKNSPSFAQASNPLDFSAMDLFLIILVVAVIGGWVYYSMKHSKDGKKK